MLSLPINKLPCSKFRGVALPVWTRSDCDNSYFQPITEVFLCAGFAEGGRDACQVLFEKIDFYIFHYNHYKKLINKLQGDSGGPLVLYEKQLQRYILLGIVSFGNRWGLFVSLVKTRLKSIKFSPWPQISHLSKVRETWTKECMQESNINPEFLAKFKWNLKVLKIHFHVFKTARVKLVVKNIYSI